jgi:DNA-binding transcriptional regulator PaaX
MARKTKTSAVIEKPIAGKLGSIAKAVAKPKGASIDDLIKVTGWQPHTVRAALTRLRQRGIDAKLTTVDDRKVYRVTEAGV